MTGRAGDLEPAGFLDRLSVRRAWRQPAPDGFVLRPEPLSIGSVERGRQMLSGHLTLGGHVAEISHASIWDEPAPDAGYDADRQGFGWLDDLAALASPAARRKAQGWLWDWIEVNRSGKGLAWLPGVTGRRVLRWVFHAPFLMHATNPAERTLFLRALSAQVWHLSRRAVSVSDGMDRIEALTGLVVAALCLDGRSAQAEPAMDALSATVDAMIDDHGGVPTRNAEALLSLALHLTWVQEALTGAGQTMPPGLAGARDAIVLTLRSLRHGDGALPRFHGSGAGAEGVIERVLAASPIQTRRDGRRAMGYARLSARRTSVIMDVSPPPVGQASQTGHASTLAFELTSGRRPLIVNCGPGAQFGRDWRRAARATAGHSTLSLEGYSSAQMGPPDPVSGLEPLVGAPGEVLCDFQRYDSGDRVQAVHEGYNPSHGLTHLRLLELAHDGRLLTGEDRLLVASDDARARFERAKTQNSGGVTFHIRLHLHPDVDAVVSSSGRYVTMALRSGEMWRLDHDSPFALSLESSVYLDPAEMLPQPSKQVVLSGRAIKYATHVRWTLRKSDETAIAVRDVARSEDDPYH